MTLAAAGSRPAHCRNPSRRGHGAKGLLALPHVLERAEAQLLVVVEARVVDAPHVLLPVLVRERVVRLRRFPAIDHDVAAGLFHVAQKLGADETLRRAKELLPLAARPVGALERLGIANLVAEDERYHGAIMGTPR